jgi:demethylmenaquinone methyltransferase/2-methoxy-6-polyprenyl-1,4-benzoquinol methylase
VIFVDTAAGTTPPGTTGEQQAARWVRQMFSTIAPRYDVLNHILSFNIDRRWRKALMQSIAPILTAPGARVLDLCCGTGDVLLDLQSVATAEIVGADFSHPMLIAARKKVSRKGFCTPLVEADALELPLASESLDAISIAFGFRNLANYKRGLKELYRVLKPGGKLAILEFSHPPGAAVKIAYAVYSRILLPVIGTLISGSSKAYTYLPDSIRKFPRAHELATMMQQAGFAGCTFQLLTGGIAALHTGVKTEPRLQSSE